MIKAADYTIAPSILAADFARLGEEVDAVLTAGADVVHFDVMDSHYVPNLSFGPLVCDALRGYGIQAPIDVHLMVDPVDRLINEFADAGASSITIHPEATRHLDRSLALIRDRGCSAGLALNPATPLHWLDHTLARLDRVLVMSVNPGFGGQSFIPQSLPKIGAISARLKSASQPVRLEVDGGVKIDNIGAIAAAGANAFVAGSAIFASDNYRATIDAMRAEIAAAIRSK